MQISVIANISNKSYLTDMGKIFLKRIGKNIKKFRLEKRISQQDLGLLTGLSRGSISMIETGRQNLPLTKFCNIAQIFKINPKELLK